MDKVDPLAGGFSFRRSKTNRGKRKDRIHAQPFNSLLETAAQDQVVGEEHGLGDVDGELEELLDAVHDKGEELKGKPTLANIRIYKRAVRGFLAYVVKHGLVAEEHMSGTNVLKRKKFTLLQVVDRKLEQLAAGVLRGQQEQLRILKQVDEIHGLLVDLLQ
jgi:hypothetical protein